MDMEGKALMVGFDDEEEEQIDLFQFSTPEFAYYADLAMENHVEVAANSLASANFVKIPSSPKPVLPPPPPPPGLNPSTAQFLFKKVLKSSDVGQARRIIIPKANAEKYLPCLIDGDGIFIYMDDMDAPIVWVFRFRYWQNNNSRMYVLEKTGDFVREHDLGAGDMVLIYKDEQTERYGIQAKKIQIKQITPQNGANASMSYYGNFVQRDNFGSYIYPESNVQNYMMNFLGGPGLTVPNVEQSMNFLGGPGLTVPNVEQSMSYDAANMHPYYYM